MKKKSFFSRLQVRIILACSFVLLLAITVLGFFSFRQYRDLLQENARNHATDISAAVEAALETHIDGYGEFSLNAFLSEDVHTMLDDSVPAETRQTAFQDYCSSTVGYRRYLNAIYMVTENGTVLISKGYTRRMPQSPDSYAWYQRLLEADGAMVVDYGPSWLSDTYPSRSNVVTVGRLMKSVIVEKTSTYYTPTGAIIFELSPSFMSSLLRSHDMSDTQLILTDGKGCIIYDSSGKTSGLLLSDCYPGLHGDGSYEWKNSERTTDLFVQKKELNYGWKLFLLFDLTEVMAREGIFLRFILVLAIAILLVSLLLSGLFSENIVRPIARIRDNMKKIENGHLEERLTGNFPYELEGITGSYNHMLDSLQGQINENYVMKLENLDSRYRALQAQINPHFIFNVLDMINSEMILSGNASAAKTIRSLARLIRYNLDNDQEMVPLREEKAYIENYCSLLREVYSDFRELTIDLPEDLPGRKIPSHCIQPLIENSIKHGFTGIDRPGCLEIRAVIKDGSLQISVRDNGNGISAEKLAELTARLDAQENAFVKTKSIGLLNIHRRLRMKFGPACGLRIDSIPGEYTEVTVLLPE